jgi:hypothetical protein
MDANHTLRKPKRSNQGNGGGGRDDCWTESATETLIEAWGDRYLRLNRGNLRQKDWTEVAHAVNSRRTTTKPPRTDVQCKNRIDTLKKKYKLEKSKPSPSKWPFFQRLNHLIGPSVDKASKPKPNRNPNPNALVLYSSSSESSQREEEVLFGGLRKNRMDSDSTSLPEEISPYKELARAVLRFGEIYERTENLKQQQMIELEKQRMEFTKELEFQRMNMFMEAQIKLEKMKCISKGSSSAGKKS